MEMLIFVLLVTIQMHAIAADDSCPGLSMCFCNKEKTSVNCEGKRLVSVPTTIPTTVVKLYLGRNLITNITAGAFSSLLNLQELRLFNNQISIIKPYAFGNLSLLNYLDISNNKLVNIVTNAFSGMQSLTRLILTTNHIQDIDAKAFQGTESITYLSLQSNQLLYVPPLEKMLKLEKLVLEGNKIQDATFPDTYSYASKLAYIGLSSNNIDTLSNYTFESLQNASISSLYLSKNKLRNIENGVFHPFVAIQSLKLGFNPLDGSALKSAMESLQGKNMVSLDISGMQLKSGLLNDTFAMLKNTSITTLNMAYNTLQMLPNNIFKGLNVLLHLDLSNCQIHVTSNLSFSGLDRLNILNLAKNHLIDVPKNLPSSLVRLFLDDNEITQISDDAFSNLVYLQELRISYNKIQKLEQDSFRGLVSLNKLYLYNNYIATLPGEIFQPLVRLTSLNLAKNNLATIQEARGRFSSLGSLVYLNLADNKCHDLRMDIFQDTTALKYLHLENNLLGALISKDFGGKLFQNLSMLNELYIMNNNVSTLPDPLFEELSSLKKLNLSSNRVTQWGPNLFKSTQQLQFLDLSCNLVATVQDENVHDFVTLKELNLSGNPFACNCDLRWFRDWMNKTSVLLANNVSYTCNGPNEWTGKPLLTFDRQKINCFFFTWQMIVGVSVFVAVIIIVIGIVLYKKRWWIKLFFYKRTRKFRTKSLHTSDGLGNYGAINDNTVQMFDAYISCAEDDKDWALKYLLPGVDCGESLDKNKSFGGKYKLYFEDRDSKAGHQIVGNIYENICISRKVLVVLSKHYMNSINRFEYELSVNQMNEKKLEEIVLINIDTGFPQEKIPKHLACLLKKNKIIEWKEDAVAQEWFTQEINTVLSKIVNAADIDTE